jgi:hypothetical protein
VSESSRPLSPSRSPLFRPIASRERSASKPSQSCRSSALQSKIRGGAQSRAREIVSAICATRTNEHFHTPVAHNLAVEPTPTSVAFRRGPIDDRCPVALSADQSWLNPTPRDVQSTRNAYRVHHHAQMPGSCSTTSSSLPARRCATRPPTLAWQESGATTGARDTRTPSNQMAPRRRLTNKFKPKAIAIDRCSAGRTARSLHLRRRLQIIARSR